MNELFRLISEMPVGSRVYIQVMLVLAAGLLLTMLVWWIQAWRWASSGFEIPGQGMGALHSSLESWTVASAGRTDPVDAFRSTAEDRLDAFRATANLLTLLGLLGTVAGLVQVSGGLPQVLQIGQAEASQMALSEAMAGLQLAFVSTLVGVAGALSARVILIPMSAWVSRAAARYGSLIGAPEEEPTTDDRLDGVAARLEDAAAALHSLTGAATDGAAPLMATATAFERAVGQLQAGIQAREQVDAEARRAREAEEARRSGAAEELLQRIGREWTQSVSALGQQWTGAAETWSQRQEHALTEWRGQLTSHSERLEALVAGIEAGWASAAAQLARAVADAEERQLQAQERVHEQTTQGLGERERAADSLLQRFGAMWDASIRQLADRVSAGNDSLLHATEVLQAAVEGVDARLVEVSGASAAYREAMESVGKHLNVLGTGTQAMLEHVDSHLKRLADTHVSAVRGAEDSLLAALQRAGESLGERMDHALDALGNTATRLDAVLRVVEDDRDRAAVEGASLTTAADAIGERLARMAEQERALLQLAGELRESLYAADAVLRQLSDHLSALHAADATSAAALP